LLNIHTAKEQSIKLIRESFLGQSSQGKNYEALAE
jgi:hypothetical protein